MKNKQAEYAELTAKRKTFKFTEGLSNPADTGFDGDYLEPWSQWQGNLDASIVVVGQEFCDLNTFNNVKGTVERKLDVYEYPANRNLVEYFKLLDIDLGHPLAPNRGNPVFFTNAVMGLKGGSMSSNFKDTWLKESREVFLAPLLQIIQPRVIIAIGTKATASLGKVYDFPVGSHADMVTASPIRTNAGPLVFPVYHTGGLGLANRPKAQQIEDWKRIRAFL